MVIEGRASREKPATAPLGVRVVKAEPDHPDALATWALLQAYSDGKGFHCPICKATITNPEEAIQHLAEEINKAFTAFQKGVK